MKEQPKLTLEDLSNLSEDEELMLYIIITNGYIPELRLFRTPFCEALGFDQFKFNLQHLIDLKAITLEVLDGENILAMNKENSSVLDLFYSMLDSAYSLDDEF